MHLLGLHRDERARLPHLQDRPRYPHRRQGPRAGHDEARGGRAVSLVRHLRRLGHPLHQPRLLLRRVERPKPQNPGRVRGPDPLAPAHREVHGQRGPHLRRGHRDAIGRPRGHLDELQVPSEKEWQLSRPPDRRRLPRQVLPGGRGVRGPRQHHSVPARRQGGRWPHRGHDIQAPALLRYPEVPGVQDSRAVRPFHGTHHPSLPDHPIAHRLRRGRSDGYLRVQSERHGPPEPLQKQRGEGAEQGKVDVVHRLQVRERQEGPERLRIPRDRDRPPGRCERFLGETRRGGQDANREERVRLQHESQRDNPNVGAQAAPTELDDTALDHRRRQQQRWQQQQ